MVNINLYPWRVHIHHYQLKIFKKRLVLITIMLLFFIGILHIFLSQKENIIKNRMQMLNAQLNNLQTSFIAKTSSSIGGYSNDQKISFPEKLFSELTHLNQWMVCFLSIERSDKTYSFIGKSQSISDLTQFLSHWNFSDLFTEIKIKSMEQNDDGYVKFGLEAEEVDHAIT